MNKLYEISNQGDVVLSFNVPVTLDGYTYAANEPCLFLENVMVRFNYLEKDASSTARGNVVAFQELIPSSIALSETSLTTKICDLVLSRASSPMQIQRRAQVMGNEDGLYLTEEIITSKPVFIYNNKGQKVGYDRLEENFIAGQFDPSQKYVVYYYVDAQGEQYGLESSSLPYMNMQITLQGNTDKQRAKTVMYFPCVVLNAVPVFAGTYGSVLSVPLTFDVIDKSWGKPQVVFN